jgi:hypothetical protein
MARRRPLPGSAAAALEIVGSGGSREMRANDLGLRMHQRGFDGRATNEALRAFERRGWLIKTGGVIALAEEAFAASPATLKRTTSPSRKHTRLPRGLFTG